MNAPSHRPSPLPPPPSSRSGSRVRIADGAFVADATIDGWVRAGEANRAGALLTLRDGRRFVLRDALRVLGRRNGETDPYGLTGKVDTLRDLVARGTLLAGDSIRLGPAVYDVEHGALVHALGSPDESGALPRMD